MKFRILMLSSTLYFSFMNSYRALTVISYPELTSAYAFRLKGFQLDKLEDPFFRRNAQHLKEMCDEISLSTHFLLLEKDAATASLAATNDRQSADSRTLQLMEPLKIEYRRLGTRFREKWSHLFPFISISAATTPVEETELKEQQMYWDELPSRYRTAEIKLRKSDKATVRVGLFPCPETYIPEEYRFISYGFHEDFSYLFVRHKAEEIVFAGLIERTPNLRTPPMTNERVLEKYFINALHQSGKRVPLPLIEDPVCKLNRNQRFRLCSLVHGAFVQTGNSADKLVFAKVDACEAHKSLLLKEVFEKPDKYYTRDVRVNALPCFMLNADGTTGTLYVTHDPQEIHAIFLFVLGRDYVTKGASIWSRFHLIKAHIRDVSVLKHATYFY